MLLQLVQRVELIDAAFAPELVLLIYCFFHCGTSLVVFVAVISECLFLHVDPSDVFDQASFLAECPITYGAVEISPLLVNSSDMNF